MATAISHGSGHRCIIAALREKLAGHLAVARVHVLQGQARIDAGVARGRRGAAASTRTLELQHHPVWQAGKLLHVGEPRRGPLEHELVASVKRCLHQRPNSDLMLDLPIGV